MECFSKIIEEVCGCVIYYMPRINVNTKICNRAESKCYNPIRISIERGDNTQYRCKCMPGCDELNYFGEQSSAPLETTNFFQKDASKIKSYPIETIKRDIGIVQIFYADSFFRAYVKEELIGFTEFLCIKFNVFIDSLSL